LPIFEGAENRLDWVLWDTCQAAAATGQTLKFFNRPIGHALTSAISKDKRHTNFAQANQLESEQAFRLLGVSFHVRDAVAADTEPTVDDMVAINDGYVELKGANQKVFWEHPAALIPSAGGELIIDRRNTTADTTTATANRGAGIRQNVLWFRNPIVFEKQEYIQVDFRIELAIVAVTDIMFALHGELFTPVN
jgi:hypothetical protein